MKLPSDDATVILTSRNPDDGAAAIATMVSESQATADASWLGRWWQGTGAPLLREPVYHQLDIADDASPVNFAAHLY